MTHPEATPWERLTFALENREKPTLMVIGVDCGQTRRELAAKLERTLPRYRFFNLDLAAAPGQFVYSGLQECLPEAVRHSRPAEYIVNVFGLEARMLDPGGQDEQSPSALIAELNLKREPLFRAFPFIIILWTEPELLARIKSEARDFWDWVTCHFEFAGTNAEQPGPPPPPARRPESAPASANGRARIQELRDQYEALPKAQPASDRELRQRLNLLKLLARAQSEAGEFRPEAETLAAALALTGTAPAANFERAELLGRLGEAQLNSADYPAALASYRSALELTVESERAQLFLGLATLHERQGQWPEALAQYENALLHGQGWDNNTLAATHRRMGQVHEALRQAGPALARYRLASQAYEREANLTAREEVRALIQALQEKQSRPNPYTYRNMLPLDSEIFVGRVEEFQRIANRLNHPHPQCVAIIGERRIGKSSLAYRVYRAMAEDERTMALYLDCDELEDDCNSTAAFFAILNRLFLSALQGRPALRGRLDSCGESLFADYPSFSRWVKREGKKETRFLLFLDEFEQLPKKEFANDSFFSNLRALANNPENRLAYVTISQKGLNHLTHQAIQSSGFWNIFTTETIGLLDDQAVHALRHNGFAKYGFLLTSEEEHVLDHYAGAFPFFNQIGCSRIFDAKNEGRELDRDALTVELLPYYQRLWEGRSENEKIELRRLSAGENGKDSFLLPEMQTRGLVVGRNGGYRVFSGFLGELIARHF